MSTISYGLYLCRNNLGGALIYRLHQAGVPPQQCFGIGIEIAFASSIPITNRIEQAITAAFRDAWNCYRSGLGNSNVSAKWQRNSRDRGRTSIATNDPKKSNRITRRFGKQTVLAKSATSFLQTRGWGQRTKPPINATAT
ncbi:MAG: hypothetical protein VYA84_20510 [Planctomycetota bacterium]|nr:hypothetical protein [Planctomycetota bacterium]